MKTVSSFATGLGWALLATALFACRRDAGPAPSPGAAASGSFPEGKPATSTTALSPLLSRTNLAPASDASASRSSGMTGSLISEPSGRRGRSRAVLAPKAGERVPVPGGRFSAGSLSGEEGRDPRSEAAAFSAALSAFEIDRLPFPNNPAEPPRTDVTQREASRLCTAQGERLCSELEWEYACKGTAGDAYPTGDAWDATCSNEPTSCGSGFGVLGMGALREWTAGELLTIDKDARPLAAIRGATPNAEATEHRCARRAGAPNASHARELGFRCCAGPPNAASIAAPKLGPTARKISLDPSQVAEIFATIPQLASVQPSIKYFVEPEDTETVLRRGRTHEAAADSEGFTLTTSPLLWNPAPGEEIVVLLGHSGKDSFVVALYRLADNRYRLASSLLLANDLGPFALAYHPNVRERLLWSSCWKCAGEGGAVTFRDGRRVVVVQQ